MTVVGRNTLEMTEDLRMASVAGRGRSRAATAAAGVGITFARDDGRVSCLFVYSILCAAPFHLPFSQRHSTHASISAEVEAIADLLMEAFHGDPSDPRRVKPAFDSYLRRYKLNHLAMCFDAIEEHHRTLLVACAVTREVKVADSQTRSLITVEKKDGVSGARDGDSSLTQQDKEKETIVGFCSVDGRPNDPSSRLEHSSASSLANSPLRPYLSDLGVSHFHRRKGVGIALVKACEDWVVAVASNATANTSTNAKGDSATELYLRVDGDNTAARGLYVDRLGYDVVSLPFGGHAPGSAAAKYDKTVLLRKSFCCENDTVDNDGEDLFECVRSVSEGDLK